MANTTATTEIKEKPAKTGKYLFQKGYDPRRNLNGHPKGEKNFDTLFEEAIKIIVKEKKIPGLQRPEIDLVIKAVIEGLKGNYPYFRDIMDRRFGKAKESIDLTSGGEQLGVIILPLKNKQNENRLEGPTEAGNSPTEK